MDPVIPLPLSTILSAVLVPVIVLLSCSVVGIVVVSLVFRRKYKEKTMEQQNLEAEMVQLKSSSILKSPGKYGLHHACQIKA